MQELIFANPRRKSRKGKMPAALKRYWASKRGTTKRKRKTSHRKSARKARGGGAGRVTVVTVRPNPSSPKLRGRRRRSARGRIRGFASRLGGFVPGSLVPAAVGAGGALGIDMLWGYLPLPANMQTGPLAPVARLALAALLGFGVGKFTSAKFGEEVTVGAVTVTVYDLIKAWLQANVPSIPLCTGLFTDGLGEYSPAMFSPRRLGLFTDGASDASWACTAEDFEEAAYYN
ncbi:MAG: hypothetical protein ACREHV_07795 [Rhizomicrobium sp.]